MTCIASFSSSTFAVMVSDRRVSLTHKGEILGIHNSEANKCIIYTASDGTLSLGYTGPAYIGSLKTDDWIAKIIIGDYVTGIGNSIVKNQTIDSVIAALVIGMNGEADAWNGLQLLITGFKVIDDLCINIDLIVTRNLGKKIEIDGHMRRRENQSRIRAVGSPPNDAETHAEFPPNYPAFTESEVQGKLSRMVRSVAVRDKGVGQDLMIVTVPPPGYGPVYCRYDAAPGYSTGVDFYTPWIISVAGFYASPQIASGFSNFDGGGVNIVSPAISIFPAGNQIAATEVQPNIPRPK